MTMHISNSASWTKSQITRVLLLVEGAAFALAGMVHSGMLINGYADRAASIAESTIATVLFLGSALTFVWPSRTRAISLVVQTFALLGTLLGAFVIAIGIGPRTVPDVVFHASILAVLGGGMYYLAREGGHR
jgi:hypothetical protein